MTLKIAPRWFERKTFSDGITLLWEPHVHPMLRCNIWHVRGRHRDLVIDTGMGIASLRDAARDLFEEPLAAVATHSHLDHMGGMHEFDCRLCHAAEAPFFTAPSDNDRLTLEPDHWLALYMPDLDATRLIIDALPFEGFDPHAWRLQPASPTALLADGDQLDLGDRHFEVLHLPGHSPGSIALFEHLTGTLFSGDVIYDGELLDEIPGADREHYIRSLQRLNQLPVQVVHAGHEGSFGGERLRELVLASLTQWQG